MGRSLLIVALAAVLMATGVAGATPANEIHIPIAVSAPTRDPATVVVERGDHLWKISVRRLEEVAPEHPIAPYWRDVVDVNTPRLRSGDPDLVFPGEVIELPPTGKEQ